MVEQKSAAKCPLCNSRRATAFHRDRKRDYGLCPHCDLVFVPPEFHLTPEAEKARYDFHRHSLTDAGYRAFLNRLCSPLAAKLPPGACGLDYGSGREPTLAVLFAEAGFPCASYDLYFANDPAALEKQYDFLTCSETAEHFTRPREEFERILRLVKPGGWIGLMTQLRDEAPPFEKWFYKDDATHVCFFSRRTFDWLGAACGLRTEFHPHSTVLFQLPENAAPALQ